MNENPPLAPVLDPDSFDIENSEDVIGFAKQLIDGSHPGILGSVDQNGNPEIRWMATLSFDEFPVFHTLTAPDNRKVDQIKLHPTGNWMFSNHDLSLTLNLIGKGRILTDTRTLKRVWKQIEDKSQAFFLNQYAKGAGFVVLETTVETIECSSAKNSLRFALQPSELAHRA